MPHLALALVTVFIGSTVVRAQDMPLSQILIEGEDWKKVDGKKPAMREGVAFTFTGASRGFRWNTQPGEAAVFFGFPGDRRAPDRFGVPFAKPSGLTFSPDGGTLFVADAGGTFIWAFRMANSEPHSGSPYAPLRLGQGKMTSDATGLATDKDGRIYAATPIGVQVFDPTGRLCGVVRSPAPGTIEHMHFEDDRLTLWIGEVKYTRKLKTRGLK